MPLLLVASASVQPRTPQVSDAKLPYHIWTLLDSWSCVESVSQLPSGLMLRNRNKGSTSLGPVHDHLPRMREKLVYRSHFQPAPRVSSEDVIPQKARRGSPYRVGSRQPPIVRYFVRAGLTLITMYIALVWVRSLTGLDITFGCAPAWFWRQARVKSMQEWREKYDMMELGLYGLPLSFTLPTGDQIPSVALGTWQAPPGSVGNAVEVGQYDVLHDS